MLSMSAEGRGGGRLASEESIVDVVLVVEGEAIKPELDRRSSPVWVIPILLHLANLVFNLFIPAACHQMTPACLALLPIRLGNCTAGHHPIRNANFTRLFSVQNHVENLHEKLVCFPAARDRLKNARQEKQEVVE